MRMGRTRLLLGSVLAGAAAAMHACSASRAREYYDGPAYERPDTALEGWRECGYLLNGRRVGHWIEYRVEEGGIWIRSSAFFRDGKETATSVILARGGRVEDLIAFDADGVVRQDGIEGVVRQDGFMASWNVEEGRLRWFGLWRDGREEGWHYYFDSQTKIFYENGRAVERVKMSPDDGRDLNVFRDRPDAMSGDGR